MSPKVIYVAIWTAIIIASVLAYHLIIRQPAIEREHEVAMAGVTLRLYEDCRAEAFEVYDMDWEARCDYLNGGLDCSLPQNDADRLNARYAEALDRCAVAFQQK